MTFHIIHNISKVYNCISTAIKSNNITNKRLLISDQNWCERCGGNGLNQNKPLIIINNQFIEFVSNVSSIVVIVIMIADIK